ncbi:MAG: 4Fe-4S dicluster domain-containing protein, partial [Clostridiales Family XIII bacterium]|nr:4Fe-4S dicluster domain-containing protein [Clostridiales Family XIII bacterium]
MERGDIKNYAEGCLRDNPSPCQAACPYGLDVRRLVEFVRAERWDRAGRFLRAEIKDAETVCAACPAPCRGACVSSDAPVDLKRIEQAVLDGDDAGRAAALAEAGRCTLCTCSACIDACVLIRYFRQNPKRIAADLGVTVLPVASKIKHVASRMIHSCNLCGLCTAVCPVGVDTCAAMAESRRIMKEGGNLPAAYHDFWMEDMAFSMSDEAYAVVRPEAADGAKAGAASLLFFPGCQLAASLPGAVSAAYAHILGRAPDAAMLLACCGVPADWACEEEALADVTAKLRADWEALGRPEVLFACTTCKKTFEKTLPEVRGQMLYEWLADSGRQDAAPTSHCETVIPVGAACSRPPNRDVGAGLAPPAGAAVFDPCASDAATQAAVRKLLGLAGQPLPDAPSCCGFGGHIYPANPGLLGEILRERKAAVDGALPSEAGTDAASAGGTALSADAPCVVTYCANCRDLFLSEGMDARHVLEVLFPPESGR